MCSKRLVSQVFSVCLLVFLSGCLGLSLKQTEVVFINPYQFLNAVSVSPNAEERAGVKLRVEAPAKLTSKTREETTLYAQIQNGKGLRMQFAMDRLDRYRLTGKDSYLLSSETTIQGHKGKILEEKELSTRGEIRKFIRGFHRSQIGNFKINRWTRTSAFPDYAVRVGDHWGYDELLEVALDSRWVKEINPQPYRMKATCTLKGFALVKGQRTAVIEIQTTQTKREHLKLLFKELIFDIEAKIQQTMFLDYKSGDVVATITQIQSHTSGVGTPIHDTGQSQSISYRM